MKSEKVPRLSTLPPKEHAIGIYIGLIIGGLVLGIGAIVLFRDLLLTFTGEGLKLTDVILFRTLLFIASSLASLACFFAFFKLVLTQRMLVKKVDETFEDFTTYARPLVEELIRQRIISEELLEKLDRGSKRGGVMADASGSNRTEPSSFREYQKREEFLVFIALLSSMTVALFIYLEKHPWQLVPYSIMILALAWWFIIAKYFDLVYDIRSYYLPAIFIVFMPSLSVIIRAFMLPHEAVYVIFLTLFVYVWSMYTYFNYVDRGIAPEVFSIISAKLMKFPHQRRVKKFVGREALTPRAAELFPPKESEGLSEKEKKESEKINALFPPNTGERHLKRKEGVEKPYQRLKKLFLKKRH